MHLRVVIAVGAVAVAIMIAGWFLVRRMAAGRRRDGTGTGSEGEADGPSIFEITPLMSVVPFGLLAVVMGTFGVVHPFGTGGQSDANAADQHHLKLSKNAKDQNAKDQCAQIVTGQVLFQPYPVMRQGQAYTLIARVSRNSKVDIKAGLNGDQYTITDKDVSCTVSVFLDSSEADAFKIERMPVGRTDDLYLPVNAFSQWDWRVTPLKHGVLHLLLYVHPDMVITGEGVKPIGEPQTPSVITVIPDYGYMVVTFIKDYWVILSVLLTAIVVPFVVWVYGNLKGTGEAKKEEKKKFGF